VCEGLGHGNYSSGSRRNRIAKPRFFSERSLVGGNLKFVNEISGFLENVRNFLKS